MTSANRVRSFLSARLSAADLEHVSQVAAMAGSEDEELTAFLHDFVEDGYGSWDEVEAVLEDRAASCMPALRLLTRGPEAYLDYISQIAASGNHLALAVKALDLIDHLSPRRWQTLKPEKIARYIVALEVITRAGKAAAIQQSPHS